MVQLHARAPDAAVLLGPGVRQAPVLFAGFGSLEVTLEQQVHLKVLPSCRGVNLHASERDTMSVESTLASLARRPGQAAYAALNCLTASQPTLCTGFDPQTQS